ncbi:uncharacterized protein LOC108605531 isoform X2 [Drosophila busckii]|uniref:uncharacterized protein LOC108605531 isoform X2 n=1 Tax=Drosophila busckii TaxID=30019 RepID=UPI00083F0CB4|nr:uncharacterized protein LOC108605531 isoform X2 [Drosophila busckii]
MSARASSSSNIANIANTNTNNNNNGEGTNSFKYYMEKCYVLPVELKNDIIYCQRAMRDFLKVHGLVSDVFKEQADADPVQMQRILDELETEVYEINAEQQFLMMRLNDDLDTFYKKLEANNVLIVPEQGNEYISSQIVPFIGDPSYKITPQSVLTRDNEEMLIRKHFLISQDEEAGVEPLKLSELDDNMPLMLVNPAAAAAAAAVLAAAAATAAPALELNEVKLLQQLSEQPESLLRPSLLSMEPQRSLLIPREPLPPLVAVKKRANCLELKPSDFEVTQSRMNLRQALRRARKTKQQPRQFDDEDVLELPTEKQIELPPSIKNKPMKPMDAPVLPKKSASNKQYKTRNTQGAARKTTTTPPPPPPPPAPATPLVVSEPARISLGSSGSSDDLHQELEMEKELELEHQRLSASAAQWRDEPRETRVLPAEYGREHFLGLFGLYTHEVVKKLCQRHSKRKRRPVQNANGTDFHYGQQLAAIDAVRQKRLKDKPEFLLSPKEKRLQAKKAHKANAAAVAAAAAASSRKSKSNTPEKLEEALSNIQLDSGKQRCKECKKFADNLLSCQRCQGVYHLECHGTKAQYQYQQSQLTNRCPQCVYDWSTPSKLSKSVS